MPCPIPESYNFTPIGIIRSPYREKFAVPRQPGLVTAAIGELELLGECNREEILRGLEDFSHLWITFVFHKVIDQGWTPTVRPPRLGGNARLGVFATRSPFRPNPIGLSVVEFKGVEKRGKQWLLKLAGIDMVDGTPVLDIKPYVPYADALPNATGGFTDNLPPHTVEVRFSPSSLEQLERYETEYPSLKQLIEQVVGQQPQPAYHAKQGEKSYGMALYDFNIRWHNSEQGSVIDEIQLSCQEKP